MQVESRAGRAGSPRAAPHRFPADFLLLGTVLLWSFNFTAIKYAVSHGLAPLTYASVRWGIAALAFSVITWRREGGLRVSRSDFVLLAALGVVGLWLNQTAFAYAARLAPATTIALLFGTLPAFVGLFSQLGGVERLRLRHWLGTAVSFSGVALVALGAGGGVSGHLGGVLLALATAATFAVYSVGVVPLMRRHSPYRINALTGLVGAVLLGASGSGQLAGQSWDVGALVWGALLYSALVSVGLGNVLWFKAIDRVGPGRASLYTNLQPFLGAVFAVLVLSETLRATQLAGGLVIGAGILLARERLPAPPVE